MRSEQLGLERHRNLKGLRQLLALLLMAEFEQRLHWLDCLLLCKGSTGEIARRSKCPKLREGQYVEYPLVLSRFSLCSGTGSNPPECPGWHLPMRLIPNHRPRKIPWVSMASIIYAEQVG